MTVRAKDISGICKIIMDDPMVKRVTTGKERDSAVAQAKKNPTAPQEILFDNTRTSEAVYINRKEKVMIELFKSLFIVTENPGDKETINALKQTGQLIKEARDKKKQPTYKININPGDINFRFYETELSKKISNEIITKHGILLLGNKCFIEQSINMHNKLADDPCNIVLATQDDLKAILERLQNIE